MEILSHRLHMISEESIREHQHYYTQKELVGLMEKHGCRVVAYKRFELGLNELIVGKRSNRNERRKSAVSCNPRL